MINSSREYKPWLDLGMEVQPRARIRAAYGKRAHSGSILDSACRAWADSPKEHMGADLTCGSTGLQRENTGLGFGVTHQNIRYMAFGGPCRDSNRRQLTQRTHNSWLGLLDLGKTP